MNGLFRSTIILMLPFLIIVQIESAENRKATEEELLRSFPYDFENYASHLIKKTHFDAETYIETDRETARRERQAHRAIITETREKSLSAVPGEDEEQFSRRVHLLSNLSEHKEFKCALFLFIRNFYFLSQEQRMKLLDVIIYGMNDLSSSMMPSGLKVHFVSILYSDIKSSEYKESTLTDLAVFLLAQERLSLRRAGIEIFRSILFFINIVSEAFLQSGLEKNVFLLDGWKSEEFQYDPFQTDEWQAGTWVKKTVYYSIWEHFFHRILVYAAPISSSRVFSSYVTMCLSSEIWRFIGYRREYLERCIRSSATRFSREFSMRASDAAEILRRITDLEQYLLPVDEDELEENEDDASLITSLKSLVVMYPELPELSELDVTDCSIDVNLEDIKESREEARESVSL